MKATPKNQNVEEARDKEELTAANKNASEAVELFHAIELAHEADGEIPTWLANMLRERLWRVRNFVVRLYDIDNIPF